MKSGIKSVILKSASVLILVGVITTGISLKKTPSRPLKKDSPEEPYENFMLQRTYPNKSFDIKAYRTGLDKAAADYASQKKNTAALTWQLEGPGNIGGRFNCIAVCPGNSSIMYAGSANGGVWKTSDNAQTWTPLTDALPCQAIGAIAINPSNVNEIWIGTGDVNISGTMYAGSGVYKSTDAGLTWVHQGLASSYVVSGIIFNRNNTSEVLIATMGNAFNKDLNRGIYKTADGGATFTKMLTVNDSTGIIDMIQHPVNPAIIYASSFTRQRTDLASVTMGTEVYVYKSIDFGQTWTKLSGGLPNGALHQRIGLSISKSNPSLLYALYSTSDGSNPLLYKSADDGTTWTQVIINNLSPSSYGSYGWYFGKIYVDPVSPGTLYMPGVDLQYSTDGGVNWSLRTPVWSSYQVHGDGHWIQFNSSSDMIYCTDGGLYRTLDGGQNWTDIENIPVNQFYSVTENPNNHGEYAGGVQDNGTMFGNASMMNGFTRLYGGDGFTVEYTSNPGLVYAESQNGNIVYDDAFNSGMWYSLQTDPSQNYNWHTPYFASKHNQNTVFFAGQNVMRIYGSPYNTYNIISPALPDPNSSSFVNNISALSQSLLDSNIIYAGTSDGRVWNTLDNGLTWTNISPFQGISYYVTAVLPSPNNASTAYVTRSGYRANDNTPLIFKSTNNGQTWTNISGNLPPLAVNAIQVAPMDENTIFIANDAGVYYTSNAGISWTRLGSNMPLVAVLDIRFNYNNTKLIAGTFGRSMYTIDLTAILTGIAVNALTPRADVQIYPNPAGDFATVVCNRKIDAVNLYSPDGSLVRRSNSGALNLSFLPAGMYIAEIHAGGAVVRKQIIKN